MRTSQPIESAQHRGLRQPAAAFSRQPAGENVFLWSLVALPRPRQQAGWAKRQQAAAVQSPMGEILQALGQRVTQILEGMKELEGMLK